MRYVTSVKRRRYLWAGAVLVVIGIATALILSEGPHDPQWPAARSARASADMALLTALDDTESRLSIGVPTGTAVSDMCHATHAVSQDGSITCERRRFRVYSPAPAYPDAPSLARSLTTSWQRQDTLCDADLGGSTACFRAGSVDLEVMVLSHSSRISGPVVASAYVESDLWNLKVGPSSIVVVASSTYYVG